LEKFWTFIWKIKYKHTRSLRRLFEDLFRTKFLFSNNNEINLFMPSIISDLIRLIETYNEVIIKHNGEFPDWRNKKSIQTITPKYLIE